ncbi:glycosyltransferase family 2 protein [Nocardioides sp. BGMRC 2183]|nr:glycosyltransferase family 2 protein [Nocardioides sp. BGMRC 2183]
MAAPQRLRIELIDRYLLTGASRDRLVDIDDLDVTGLLGQAPARPTAAPMPASQPTIGRATSGATARSEGPTIAAVLTAHAEGALAGISLHSMLEAIGRAREIGLDVEALAVLDNPTAATREVFAEADQHGLRVEEVAYADQGLVRNHAAQMVGATHLAFLDGDDLWSRNWLVEAYRSCAEDPWAIGHPEVNWFFDNQHNLYFLPDQSDPAFDPATLRVANPWDALAFAPRAAHLEHPYSRRAVDDGYAYEDWHWNLETFGGGYRHRVVPGTIHFKRRRRDSQFVRARAQQVLTRPSEQLSYSWWAEPDDASRSAIRRMPAQSRSGSSSSGK